VSRRRLRLLVAAPILALGLAGCSSSLAANDVEEGAEDALEEQIGARPDISCPEDLEAEVGAETRCTLTAGDDPTEYGVTVTVTSVEDDTANFDVRVDEEPTGGGEDGGEPTGG
jgi:hypothetical protein